MAAVRLLFLLVLVAYVQAEKAAPSLGEIEEQYKALSASYFFFFV